MLTLSAGLGAGAKIALSLAVLIAATLLASLLSRALKLAMKQHERGAFLTQQVVRLATMALAVAALVVLWMSDVAGLGTIGGLVTAGVAVALQRVITSFAAYLIILRGKSFTIGDRITIGGVRGDVIALGFMQTTVMEMGQAPGETADPPSQWVAARQFTGRLVRVTNDKIFDTPVYNYTREFQFLWEELRLPIAYKDDHAAVERILLDVGQRHTADAMAEAIPAAERLRERYPLHEGVDVDPRVYYRLTDNWIELSLRFIVPVRGGRALKDGMYRDILAQLEKADIGVASGTYEIVGLPPVRVELEPSAK